MTAEQLMLISGIGAFVLTIYWVRSRALSEKYAVGWVGIAMLVLLVGIFPSAVIHIAKWMHLEKGNVILLVALVMTYLFSFSVSVSLTRQSRANTRLMQELAIMEQRVRTLEAETRKVRSS